MLPVCLACGVPLAGDALTCMSCGQRHRGIVSLPQIPNARTAYQAAKLIVHAGLSQKSVQNLAAVLQSGAVVLHSQRPLPPVVAAELIALGCEASETLELLPAWLAQLATLRERYGIGPGVWKPVALVVGIWLAQHVLLAAGPSADIVATAVESHAQWQAAYDASEERAQQPPPAQVQPDKAPVTPQPIVADRSIPVESAAPPETPTSAESSDSSSPGVRVTYQTRNPNKGCYFQARKGYDQVKVTAYDRCYMCGNREIVWEGTLSSGEESEDLSGIQIYGYRSETEGKELNMDGFHCGGPVDVPPFDPEIFPRKPEEQ